MEPSELRQKAPIEGGCHLTLIRVLCLLVRVDSLIGLST